MHRKQPGEVEARIPGARDRMTNAERAATPLSESVDERGVLFAARRERFPEPDYFEKPDGDRDLPPLPEAIMAELAARDAQAVTVADETTTEARAEVDTRRPTNEHGAADHAIADDGATERGA